MPEPGKSGLQPKLWLVGTALLVGLGCGLLMLGQPSTGSHPLDFGPAFFALCGAVQGLVGWFALRAGDNPKDSVMADLMESQMRLSSLELEPKPLLWMTAFVLFALASLSLTMAVGEMV